MGEIQRNNRGSAPAQEKPAANPNYQSPTSTIRADRSRERNTEAGMSKAQQAATLAWEEKNRNRKTETAAVIGPDGTVDPKGSIVQKGSNRSNQVALNTDNLVENGILVHNHPAPKGDVAATLGGQVGVSLSGADGRMAISHNLKEVRAASPNYVYSMKRPASGWGISGDQFKREYDAIYKREANSYMSMGRTQMLRGKMTTQKQVNEFMGRMNALASHHAMQEMAKKYGFTYTRRKSS